MAEVVPKVLEGGWSLEEGAPRGLFCLSTVEAIDRSGAPPRALLACGTLNDMKTVL